MQEELKNRTLSFSFTTDMSPSKSLSERHFHDFYEIIYLYRGNGSYVVEGQKYELRSGTLLFLRPGEFHYVVVRPDHPYERFVLHFRKEALRKEDEAILDELSAMSEDGAGFYTESELPPEIEETVRRFRSASALPEDKASLLSRILLSELLLRLSAVHRRPPPAEAAAIGLRALRYLNRHITEPVSLDALASELLVSKYHLSRAFKEYNGIGIRHYLTEKRIRLAKHLIDSGMRPKEAAYAVGFSDYSSFYRSYRKTVGHSPKYERN